MAERLLLQEHKVSDLCIGKPALRWLPPASTLADAIADHLETEDDAAAVAVWDGTEVAGRLCMAGALFFLCSADAESTLQASSSPAAAALHHATLADLLAAGALQPVRCIDPDASVLEAVDALLGGAHTLAVPFRERRRWRAAAATDGEGNLKPCMCWVTAEDVVRFLLSHVGVFSATASRSVSDIGAVRPAALAVAEDTALSAVMPLLRTALASHASVAVVGSTTNRGGLVGEISPSALCSGGGVFVAGLAAAVARLSAGQLVSFLDWWGGAPPAAALHAVRSGLRRRNLVGMLDLLDGGGASSSSSSSSGSSSSSSSSSDEDEDEDEDEDIADGATDGRKKKKLVIASSSSPVTRRAGSWLLRRRWRPRRPEEAAVCHSRRSLVAVMVQAMVHRATHVWVVEEQELVGVVGLLDVLRVLRHHQLGPGGNEVHSALD